MKAKKILKITSLVLATLLLLLALVVLFWLGPTVKLIAQGIGSKALGTSVSIESLSINPRKGTVDLKAFSIDTHEGFSRTNTCSLADLHVSIDMGSLFSDTIIIHEIRVDSPHFTYEQNTASDNIVELIANIQEYAGIDPNATDEEKPASKKPPKKVIVESLVINDVQMQIANTDNPQLDIQLTLEQLSLSLTNGVVQLKNLSLSNPDRLATPNIFELQSIDILLDPATIYSSNVVIETVLVTSPHAFMENNPATGTIGEFLRIANTFTNKLAKVAAPVDEESVAATTASTNAPAVNVELRSLAVNDIQLVLLDSRNNAASGPKTMGSIDGISVNLINGTIQLKNFAVGNPGPLATANVFELEAIEVKLDPLSLTSGTVVIEDVQVIKPYAFLEQNSETDTVAEFMKLAESFIAQLPAFATQPQVPAPDATATESAPEPPPAELQNLYVDDIQIKLLDTTGTNATHETQTLAAIGGISVKLVEGSVQVKGITIPNPDGFTATNLFHLANIDIAIAPESVFSKQVVIQEIFVNSPLVNLEQTDTTGNLAELKKALGGFIPPAPETPDAPEPIAAAAPESTTEPIPLSEQPVILQTLFVTNLAVNMIFPIETNQTVMGEMANLNPLNKVSLGDMNPLKLVGGSDTNAPADEVREGGPITVVAFDLLTAKPLDFSLQIDQLRVGNPKGFSSPNLVSLDQFRVDIDPDTLQSDTLWIKDILIDTPRIAYERKLTTDNIKALQASIEGAVNKSKENEGKEAPEEKPAEAPAEEAGQKVIIEHLLVKNGLVKAKLSALPAAPIPLPDIEINDLGKEKGGASFSDTLTEVGTTLYDAIIGSVSSVTGFAGDALKGIGALTKLGGESGEETSESVENREPEKEAVPKEEKKKKSRRIRRPGRVF